MYISRYTCTHANENAEYSYCKCIMGWQDKMNKHKSLYNLWSEVNSLSTRGHFPENSTKVLFTATVFTCNEVHPWDEGVQKSGQDKGHYN